MSTALRSLRITKAPKAFAALAAKHNALVSMIEGTRGGSGVNVLMASSGMMISGNPTGLAGTGVAASGTGFPSGMAVRQLGVCVNGNSATVDIIGSEPY